MGYEYPGGEKMVRRGQLEIGDPDSGPVFRNGILLRPDVQEADPEAEEEGHFGLLEILSHQAEQDGTLPNLIRSRHVDGLILLGQPGKAYYRMIAQCGTPTVFLDFYDEHGNADAVVGTTHTARTG